MSDLTLGKKIIRITAFHQTTREECEEIEKAMMQGKKFIPIKTSITYTDDSDKKFDITIDLELEW